jgi:YVTN family beta-propeller protein
MRYRVLVVLVSTVATVACTAPGSVSPSVSDVASSHPPAPTLPAWASKGVAAIIDFGKKPVTSIDADENGVWVRVGYGDVVRIDPASNAVVATLTPGFTQYGNVRVGAGAVWSTDFDHNLVLRIDAEGNQVVARIAVGQNPEGLTVTDDTVWVSNHRAGSISRIDPATNTVANTLKIGPEGTSGPKGIVIAGGDLWTPVPNIGAVLRVDPDSGKVVKKFAFDDPGGVLADGRSIYVFAAETLSKIDVATNVVTALGTPDHVPAAFADDSAWAVDGTQLWRLDAHSFEPMTSWRISETEMQFARLAFAGGAVWVADEGGRVVRVNLDT